MRIGVVPSLNRFGGGIYQYSITMITELYKLREEHFLNDEFIVFSRPQENTDLLNQLQIEWTLYTLPSLVKQHITIREYALKSLRNILCENLWRGARKVKSYISNRFNNVSAPLKKINPDKVHYKQNLRRWFIDKKIDLMIYPAPTCISFETEIPYIFAVHDLQHRLNPGFPEVSANGEWEAREYLFRNGIRFATLILVDSEIGKEDVMQFYGSYGINPDKIRVLPFIPACYLATDIPLEEQKRIRETHHLPARYLFYPAQFWPHKNHLGIVKALGLIKKEHHLELHIAFAGSYTGKIRENTFQEVMATASKLGVENQIHFLGYVPENDMSGLYAGAIGLIMPSLFGPTNIPVLEAWAFGCPVLTSDIRGIREHAKDAAILADPSSIEALADGIYKLCTNESLRNTLIENGKKRLTQYNIDDYSHRLKDIIEEAKRMIEKHH